MTLGALSRGGPARLAFESIAKRFGPRKVLAGLDASVAEGEFVALVGKSGCGKSTLLRMAAGLEAPDAGRILFRGEGLRAGARGIRMMFQDARLLPWKRVLDNVALGLPRGARPRAEEMLERVGLGDRAGDWPGILSGGQRQRVALARALAGDPDVLLLDEPLGALDALTRIGMQDLIRDLWAESGFTVILVTHDMEEAVALADRVLLLEEGRAALEIAVDLPRPRDRGSPGFAALKASLVSRILAGRAGAEGPGNRRFREGLPEPALEPA